MRRLTIDSVGYNSTYDITDTLSEMLRAANAPDGIHGVFAQGSTVGLTVMRYERGAVDDLLRALERVAPVDGHYLHELTTKDPNGFSHIRSAVLGTSVCVPWIDGALAMSDMHRVVLFDFDLTAARRIVFVDTKEG